MALVFADLVKETTSTTGTGTLTLTGAVTNFQSFAAIGNANTTYYRIISGTSSEVGIGTYTLSGTTLSRDTVLYSTAGGVTKITVASGATVICTYPAEKVVILDGSGNATALGTPAAFVATNITGTASGFTAGQVTTNANLTGGVTSVGNAATVVTNANLTGDITSVGNATTLTNAPVIAKVLTGYVSGAGTVAATDSILQAIQKLNGNNATNANLTGMVTSVGNATTVVTNANLTGAVTSVGNASSLGSFTSAQLATALTDETGTGANVFATSPTLVTPALGTPSALVGTNITGTATAFTASNVTTNANLTGAVTSVGNTSSLGSFTSLQLLTALTNETGTGSAVFATSPTLVTPILGTPTSGALTNCTFPTLNQNTTGSAATVTGNATGSTFGFNSGYGSVATAYGSRAWVNFNASGTVAIRASGNVSSITDNGVGDFTVNFTTAMPDASYVTVGSAIQINTDCILTLYYISPQTTASVRVNYVDNAAYRDPTICAVIVLR